MIFKMYNPESLGVKPGQPGRQDSFTTLLSVAQSADAASANFHRASPGQRGLDTMKGGGSDECWRGLVSRDTLMNSRPLLHGLFNGEARTLALGRDLVASERLLAAVLEPRGWWDDRLMALTMTDPATKVQLFRFIDCPARARHRRSRSEATWSNTWPRPATEVPASIRLPVELAPAGAAGDRLIAGIALQGRQPDGRPVHRRFHARRKPSKTCLRLRRRRRAFTADLLGEAVLTDAEADDYLAHLPVTAGAPLRGAGAASPRSPRSTATQNGADSSHEPVGQAVEPGASVRPPVCRGSDA